MKVFIVLAVALLAIAAANVVPVLRHDKKVADAVGDDGLQCPANFLPFGEECYLFSLEEMNFTNSINHCKTVNALLATPQNDEQSTFLKSVARELGDQYGDVSWWIGGTNYGTEGNWVAVAPQGGCLMTYNDWCINEPNNYGVESCMALRQQCDYQWEDRSCDYTGYRHICQLNKII